MDNIFDALFRDNPTLIVLAPIVGVWTNWLKSTNKMAGWALLGTNFLSTSALVGAYGLYLGWTPAEWQKAPFTILCLVGGSVLVGTTVKHVQDTKRDA